VVAGTSSQAGRRTLLDNGKLKIAQGLVAREEVARVIYLE